MNQREIKFRAWDKIEKKMLPIEKLEWSWEEWQDNWYCKQLAGEFVNGNSLEYDIEKDITIMQFTNLKDKNGKEIFEGDILRYWNWSNQAKKFYSSKWIKVVKWEKRNIFTGFPIGSKNYEVIGNIYQNPELLN